MKTYQEAVQELAGLKQTPMFRYAVSGAFELLARIYETSADTVYDDVQDIIDEEEARRKRLVKMVQRTEHEARRLANLKKAENV